LLHVLSTPADDSLGRTQAKDVLARHMPGVDLLRGMAILSVVFFHGFAYSAPLFPWHNWLASVLFHLTSFGWTGVNLFFTLSGFLITGNLIDSDRKPNFYSRFYIRRALRILPAYFLVLIVLGVTRTASLNYLAVCVIFLANWPKLLLHGSFVLYPVLWSLAVEEQFYAAWPWLYRRLLRNGLFVLCVAMILLCPVLRGVTITASEADIFSKTFMIGDNLAVGAAIAILCRSQRLGLKALVWIGTALICIPGLVLIMLSNAGNTLKGDVLGASLGYYAGTVHWWNADSYAVCLQGKASPERTWLRCLLRRDQLRALPRPYALLDVVRSPLWRRLPDSRSRPAGSLLRGKRHCGPAGHAVQAILRESNHAPEGEGPHGSLNRNVLT
jgi:peptidoglycan/LPS O-acetylase OafA/YrhL